MDIKKLDAFIIKTLNEYFAPKEFYDNNKNEAIRYLENESGWVTVLIDPERYTIRIFKDVSGLDPERDNIDESEKDNYMELSVEDVLGLLDKMSPIMVTPNVEESSSLALTNKRARNLKPNALRKPKPKGKMNEERKIRQKIQEILFKEFVKK